MKASTIEHSLSWIIRTLGGGVLVNSLSLFLIDPNQLGTVTTRLLRSLPAIILVFLAFFTLPSGALGPSRYGGSNLSRLLSIIFLLGYVLGSVSLATTPSWHSIVSILCLWTGASLATWRSFTTKHTIQFTLMLTSNLLLCAGLLYAGISLIMQVGFVEGFAYITISAALLTFILSPIIWSEYPWRWTGAPPLLLCISGIFWGLNLSRHKPLIGTITMIFYGLSSLLMIIVGAIIILVILINQLTGGEKVMYREGLVRIYGIIIGCMMAFSSALMLVLHADMLLVICGILGLILSILVPLPYLANTSVADRVGFVLLVTSPLALLCGIEGCYRNSWLLGVSLLCHGCVGGYTGLVYFTASGPHPLNKYVTSFLIWLQKKPDK